MQKPGSQISLFTDEHVRRDYLKSKQWCEQHMRMKVHLTGFACAYEAMNHIRPKTDRPPLPGRDQGSLYSQQKHAIADAVEWIRTHSKFKPRIFVATTPGYLDHAKEGKLISDFVKNMKKTYSMNEFVWVRELTKLGYPHFHFIADIDKFDVVQASLAWSRYFGSSSKISIRLGSKPDAKGKRKFWISNQKMAWYLSKYIGKDMGHLERIQGVAPYEDDELYSERRLAFRTFAISQEARKESQPLLYRSYISELYNGRKQRTFELDPDQVQEGLPFSVNPQNFNWKWTGHGQTYVGFKKKSTEFSQ